MTTHITQTQMSAEEALEEAIAASKLAGASDLRPGARERILRAARGEITNEEFIQEVLASLDN